MDITIATLLIAGAVLLFLEIFLPGMISGIVGFCCIVAGVALSYSRFGTQQGTINLLCVAFVLIVSTIAWFKYFPASRMGQAFVAKGTSGELGLETESLLHQSGIAHTKLRPCGIAIINGKRIDVVTEGPFIESGTPVKVVATEGMRVVVRAST